ncbi:MAG: HDIG domain-containing protein [Chitinophagales bacterium]|nr:HDIG domain-containing protein [Chitinophagales bacterium]
MSRFLTFIVNRHLDIIRYIFILLVVLTIAFFFPKAGKFKYEFELGKPWRYENLIAPFSFGIQKTAEEIDAERANIVRSFAPYYRLDSTVSEARKSIFINRFNSQYLKDKQSGSLLRVDSARYINTGISILTDLYNRGIVNLDERHRKEGLSKQIILMKKDNLGEKTTINELYSLKEAFNHMRIEVEDNPKINSEYLMPILEEAIAYNVFFDNATTDKYLNELLENVSLNRGMVQSGEMIIQKGSIITPEKYQVLVSFRQEEALRTIGDRKSQIIFLGNFLLTLIILLIFTFFVKSFSPEVYVSNNRLVFVYVIITIMIAVISFVVQSGQLQLLYAVPFCIVAIVLRTFFGTTLALHAHIALVLLTSFLVPFGIEFAFLQMVAGMIAIFTTIKAYYWSQFFISNAIILVTYLLGFFSISIIQGGSLEAINVNTLGFLSLNVLLTLLAYPLIPVFEKIFGFVSDITLMEYSDINKPLLKELSLKAPGTFHHSLSVANLAEAAAYEIGANSLLVKVGSLYHDVGKMENPTFFGENQHSGVNPHDDLSNEDSARIIVNHVKRGIEIAKKHKVPDILIDFIRTHHGTTRVEYFYQSSLKNHPDKKVDESMFRYPGPRPYSKETAVVMMADSCEAASRSLKNPTNEDIENLVESLIASKIDQNQFVNCDITFREINIIKRVLKKMLNSMYHVRIAYPEQAPVTPKRKQIT